MADYIIKVSLKVNPSRYIFEAKEILSKHGKVEFHAVGGSITNALKTTERLTSFGYTKLESLQTSLLDEASEGRSNKAPKVIILLSKTPDFDSINAKFEEEKKGNK